MSTCIKCNKILTGDEIGVYKKLVNRMAEQFLCKACLAEEFGVKEELIDAKIKQFKKIGCLLFPVES